MMKACRQHYIIDTIFGHYISIFRKDWNKFSYDKIKFLNRLKMQNREEQLKSTKFDWNIGD